jgi:non-homologous end joining protein Ku
MSNLKPSAAWRGAIELSLNGVPLAVNVQLYRRVKKQRNANFRNMAPSGQPVQAGTSVDPVTGEAVEEPRKGVQIGTGKNATYAIIPPETVEAITERQKTELAQPNQWVPLEDLDMAIAIERFSVRPDSKVPAADQAVQILWNGLRGTGMAACAQVSLSGGHDGILAVYATQSDLRAVVLPFLAELYPAPEFDFVENEKAQALFGKAVKSTGRFHHEAYESEYMARRQRLIDAALAGQTLPEPKKAPEPDSGPDLMAVLAAAAGEEAVPA